MAVMGVALDQKSVATTASVAPVLRTARPDGVRWVGKSWLAFGV